MVTHGSLAANCKAIIVDGLESGNGRADMAVSWLPLYHDMGLIGFVLAPLCYRIPTALIPTLSFIKNATLWMEMIHKHRGTLSFAPNFAYALVTKRAKPEQIARWDLSTMRAFGCGAEPINPDTMRAFVKAMTPAGLRPEALLPCYGMAEATLAMSFVPLDEPLRTIESTRSATMARPRPAGLQRGDVPRGSQLRAHLPRPPGRGEGRAGPDPSRPRCRRALLRGPSVSGGYWKNPEATKAAFRDGWLHTGDLGYLVGGNVFVSGRHQGHPDRQRPELLSPAHRVAGGRDPGSPQG